MNPPEVRDGPFLLDVVWHVAVGMTNRTDGGWLFEHVTAEGALGGMNGHLPHSVALG
jgi:hypothetical protein